MAPTQTPSEGVSTQLALWLAMPAAAETFDAGLLSPADQARYSAVRASGRRQDFRVSRALLQHAGPAVHTVQSLSHSMGHAALAQLTAAAGSNFSLGVDLELHRPRDVRSIARFAFAPEEVDGLVQLPEGECQRRFYTLWTMKEALGKALGLSLLEALRQCVFRECEGEWRLETQVNTPCSVLAFEPRPLLMLAVAWIGEQSSILVHLHEWPPGNAGAWSLIAQVRARGAQVVRADAAGGGASAPVPRAAAL
ncbi:MAG: 4'-phosphopantetheinyl transferase family protein [Steroidobacter sp.]